MLFRYVLYNLLNDIKFDLSKSVALDRYAAEKILNVIYHPLYSMNNFVTNKSMLPQDGAQVFPYMRGLAIM